MSNLSISSNFVRFDSEGLELVVDTTTGKAYASLSATARMLETARSTIQSAILARRDIQTISADVPTVKGLQAAELLTAFSVYKLAQKYHPLLADRMGEAGANVYLLGLAGYKVAVKPNLPTDKLGWMKLAVESEEKVIALAAQLEAQKDDVQFANAIAHTQGATDISVGQFGKTLANPVGRTKMFDILREIDFIMQKPSVLPYQSQIDVGRAIDYLASNSIDVLLVGTGLTSSATRGIESVNKISKDSQIMFVTRNACFRYLKAVLAKPS